jgi:hypothetical protein
MKKETLTEQRLAKLESVVIEKFGWRPEWFEGQAVGTLHNVESEKKMREEKIEKDRLEKEAKIKEVQEREKQAENEKIERKIYRGPSM